MLNEIKRYISEEKLISDKDTIVMGVSGGADSICLLCVLNALKSEYAGINLLAVHINHGLRETAIRDQEYTEKVCKMLDVPVKVIKVDVNSYAKDNHLSTEEAGRILRYNAFKEAAEEIAGDNYKIAVAHNKDDNAETMFLNMIRGTGLKGLSGILTKRDRIIRPLLKVSRQQIEKYLSEIGMEYCTDETNLKDDYSRNKIRHHIMPVCKEINEGFLDRLGELSEQVTDAEDYLSMETDKALKESVEMDDENRLHISYNSFQKLHTYIQKRVLLEAIGYVAGAKKDIGAVHVKCLGELFALQTGRRIALPYEVTAVRTYDGVMLYKGEATTKSMPCYSIETRAFAYDENSIIPREQFLKWFDYDKVLQELDDPASHVEEAINVRTYAEGDVICVSDSGANKKLGRYFIDNKIPAEERKNIQLITIGSQVLWIIGYRESCKYRITNNTKRILEIKCTQI